MAVDFGILAQTPSIGARYAEGLQLAQAEQERNMLRAMQIQQMDMQKKNMLAQDEERKAMAQQRAQQALKLKADMDRAARNEKLLAGLGDVLRKNGYKMDRPTLGHMAEVSLQTGDEAGAKLAMEGLRALDERDALQAAFGGPAAPAAAPSIMRQPPAAAAPAAAPTNMFAGTPFDIGTTQPAPVNALAVPSQPAAAPAAPAGGMSRERLQAIILDPTMPKAAVERAKAVLASLPKPEKPQSATSIAEFNFARTPEGGGFKGSYSDFLASKQPKPPSVSLKVDAFVPASETAQAEFIKGVNKEHESLINASDTLTNISKARTLVPGASAFMGKGGEPLLAAASFLNNRLGFEFNTRGVADATELRTRLFDGIMDNLKRLDSQPSQEQQRIMQEALGTLQTDPQALPRILDKIEETVRARVDRFNKKISNAENKGVKFPFDPRVELPSAAPRGAAPIPTGPASAPAPRSAGGGNIATERQNAQAAIAAGAPEAAVRKRFKDKTGQEL